MSSLPVLVSCDIVIQWSRCGHSNSHFLISQHNVECFYDLSTVCFFIFLSRYLILKTLHRYCHTAIENLSDPIGYLLDFTNPYNTALAGNMKARAKKDNSFGNHTLSKWRPPGSPVTLTPILRQF